MRILMRLAASLAVVVPLTTGALGTATAPAAAATDPLLVSGVITHDGAPAAAARVELRAWPPVEQLAAMPTGATVERPVVGHAVAGPGGRYTLRLSPAAVAPFVNRGGTVDLELVASHGHRAVTWPFSAGLDKASGRWHSARSGGKAESAGRIDLDIDTRASMPTSPTAARPISSIRAGGADLCGHVEAGDWFYDVREKFMNIHNWHGAKATVEQAIQESSSHELGVAAWYPGKAWEPKGSLSLTQSSTSGQGARVGGFVNQAVYNSVNYREFVYKTWSSHQECMRERRPMGFYDLLNEPHTDITHIRFRRGCTTKTGGMLWKDTGTNQTFKWGVDLDVINLSAQSGYSEGTRVGFKITRKTIICTNTDKGWLEATKFDLRSPKKNRPGVV